MKKSCGCHKKCPIWAEEQIEYLRRVEVYMGTIPDKPNWRDDSVKSLVDNLTTEEAPVFDEHKLNYLFKKIVVKLTEEKFSPEEITGFLNERIKLDYGPPYCSVEEIKDFLK